MMKQSNTSKPSFQRSQAATRRLEEIVPGGAMTYARGADQFPKGMSPVISHGKGCEVWDVDGNRFIEFGGGLRSVILGHAFEPVNAAVREAIDKGCSFVRPSALELKAAELMLACVPDMDMVKFTKNGSDATTAAVKLARAATGHERVAVCIDHPFFSVDDWFIGHTPMYAGIPLAVRNLTATFPYGDPDALDELLGGEGEAFACVILEPEKYEIAPQGYLADVRRICDKHGVVMILDEMISGFRHHFGGVHLREKVTPDLATYGKAIGNGFACSALMGKRDIMQLGGFDHDRERVFLLSTTHGAETAGLAATIATLTVLRDNDVLAGIEERGTRFKAEINAAASLLGINDRFSVIGLPTDMVYTTFDASGQPSQEFRTLFMRETMLRGMLAPSLVMSHAHSDAHLDEVVQIVSDALLTYQRALNDGIETVSQGRPVRPAIRQYR